MISDPGPIGQYRFIEAVDEHQAYPGPLTRRGPRPLLFHLVMAALRSCSSTAVEESQDTGSSVLDVLARWMNPGAASVIAGHDCNGPTGRTMLQPLLDDGAMVAGIAAYRRHPSQRILADPPVFWQEGAVRLLDFAPGHQGPPVVFVPSLINRGYILDLSPRRSLMRYLVKQGVRPLLLDWGWPGSVERQFTLTDYIAGPLEQAIASLGRPVHLIGYCMGGLLSLALAQRRPDLVHALGLLATPWDFHAHASGHIETLGRALSLLEPLLDATGAMPIDALQSLFAMLDPTSVPRKFGRFGKLKQDGAQARLFVAIEDWVNDGVPLAAPVARECFARWYGNNTTCKGEWHVDGTAITPETLIVPCFAAIPGKDRIVPPESARPLAHRLQHARIIEPPVGHVSMVVGRGARSQLWQPLASWLRDLPVPIRAS